MKRGRKPGSWLLEAFESLGVDTIALARQLPLEIAAVLEYPDTIRPDDLNSVLMQCAKLTGDPHFGLHLVEKIPASALGLYAYLLLNAGTVAEFMSLAARYYAIFYRGAQVEVARERRAWQLIYRRIEVPAISQRHDTEWTLGFFVQAIRSKLGLDWQPLATSFQEPEPENMGELYRVFGQELRFNQPQNSILVEVCYLDHPFNEADSGLLSVVRDHADRLLGAYTKSETIESHVRLLMMKDIELGPPNAANIARQLGLSLATLKRRLAARKLTFRALRDGVIIDLSRRALAETDISVSRLAMHLGYSEASAFNHSFRRLVGTSPREYRASANR